MDCGLCTLAAVALVILLVFVVLVCISDADLTLMFHERFGAARLNELKDRVVWITGASTGIGAACAVQAAAVGAKVVISARSTALLEEVKKKCLEAGKQHGLKERDVMILQMDVTNFAGHQQCVDKVIKHFGKIDVVLHNAGRSQRARWEHIDLNVDREVFDLNVFSAVHLSRLVIPHFMANGGGNFALMSSVAGKAGVPFSATYTGSKHALHGYFESLRTEKVGTGITVTMLCPGPTFSNLLQVAATENAGEAYKGSMNSSDRRMTSERCAFLSLLAIAHKVEEAWPCIFPVLPLMYVNQYLPTVSKRIMRLLGPRFAQKIRDSKVTVKED